MHLALHFESLENNNVRCHVCPHNCVIAPGKTGICRIRQNKDGKLYSLTYDQASSINFDPIEKKPLYHFYPGSTILSVGTLGCNFKCEFCQNWEISQAGIGGIPTTRFTSEMALKLAGENNSLGIAFTYNEPLINYEWVLDTAKLFTGNKMKTVVVSNGYVNPEPLAGLLPFIDAANIDVKSFSERFYKKFCGAPLAPVLKTVETMVGDRKHVELTTLLIPGENDSAAEIEKLVDWISGISDSIPLHFSRYFPQYKMELPPTEMKTLQRAYDIAKKKLKYVHLGNV